MKQIIPVLLALLLLAGCAAQTEEVAYRQITAEEAAVMMEEESGYIILDVRTAEEYSEKHIPGAINLPNEQFDSVVIDLPCSIIRPTIRRKKQTFVSFDSTEDLHAAYRRMMTLAHRLLKEGGIMVFKTADFSLDNQPLWISDWSINTAIQIGFSLSDKYIYIDKKAIDAVTSTQRRAKTPTHAYFFVFRKNTRV